LGSGPNLARACPGPARTTPHTRMAPPSLGSPLLGWRRCGICPRDAGRDAEGDPGASWSLDAQHDPQVHALGAERPARSDRAAREDAKKGGQWNLSAAGGCGRGLELLQHVRRRRLSLASVTDIQIGIVSSAAGARTLTITDIDLVDSL
jgi:hypothetical protein